MYAAVELSKRRVATLDAMPAAFARRPVAVDAAVAEW